jgi:hypothetical protein
MSALSLSLGAASWLWVAVPDMTSARMAKHLMICLMRLLHCSILIDDAAG